MVALFCSFLLQKFIVLLNTLQGLAVRYIDMLKSLEPKVRKCVEALRDIQVYQGFASFVIGTIVLIAE